MRLISNETGQVSAELLLVLTAVVAVAVLLLGQLKKTGSSSEKAYAYESKKALKVAKSI